MLSHFSCVQLCVTPWTIARQASLSIGVSRPQHRSGLPCPPPGDFPHPEMGTHIGKWVPYHWHHLRSPSRQVTSLKILPLSLFRNTTISHIFSNEHSWGGSFCSSFSREHSPFRKLLTRCLATLTSLQFLTKPRAAKFSRDSGRSPPALWLDRALCNASNVSLVEISLWNCNKYQITKYFDGVSTTHRQKGAHKDQGPARLGSFSSEWKRW